MGVLAEGHQIVWMWSGLKEVLISELPHQGSFRVVVRERNSARPTQVFELVLLHPVESLQLVIVGQVLPLLQFHQFGLDFH